MVSSAYKTNLPENLMQHNLLNKLGMYNEGSNTVPKRHLGAFQKMGTKPQEDSLMQNIQVDLNSPKMSDFMSL